nr:immunoglobulin light chain junction region [Mus musculus]
CHQNNEDPLTF